MLASTAARALEARVLVDDLAPAKVLVGSFNLTAKGRVKPKAFPYSQWNVERRGRSLNFKNLETGKKTSVSGTLFRLTGTLAFHQRSFKVLDILLSKDNTSWIVHLPVDQYLYGVLAAEVPASWQLEALKAQAIASRTYFLYKKLERYRDPYDVRADTFDQVFNMNAEYSRILTQAVDETHDSILVSKDNGQIFPAYFHSDCGGKTSNEALVWRQPTSLNEPVQDPYCIGSPKNNWTFLIDKHQLMAHLQRLFFLPKDIELQSILPRSDIVNRAAEIDFIFSENIFKRVSANELRKELGFEKLKSTHFEVVQTWNGFLFFGRGFGHGVGMCQWGAQRWARNGRDHKAILNHYYPKAEIQKFNSEKFQSRQARMDF